MRRLRCPMALISVGQDQCMWSVGACSSLLVSPAAEGGSLAPSSILLSLCCLPQKPQMLLFSLPLPP